MHTSQWLTSERTHSYSRKLQLHQGCTMRMATRPIISKPRLQPWITLIHQEASGTSDGRLRLSLLYGTPLGKILFTFVLLNGVSRRTNLYQQHKGFFFIHRLWGWIYFLFVARLQFFFLIFHSGKMSKEEEVSEISLMTHQITWTVFGCPNPLYGLTYSTFWTEILLRLYTWIFFLIATL